MTVARDADTAATDARHPKNVAPPLARIAVGVVIERRRAASPWAEFVWQPVMVLPGCPEAAPWTVLSRDADRATVYAGSAEIELYRTDSGNYRDNLASGLPLLWIALRPTGLEPPYDIRAVTADPTEGEAFTQAGDDLVDAVPMPDAVRDTLAAFVAAHPVVRAFHKRERDRADPEALARRAPRDKDRGR
jgi:Protein of unknown function (DUF3305)